MNSKDLIELKEKGKLLAVEACRLDREKKYDEALKKYIECIDHFKPIISRNFGMQSVDNMHTRESHTLMKKVDEYIKRATELKRSLKRQKSQERQEEYTSSIVDDRREFEINLYLHSTIVEKAKKPKLRLNLMML
eukprot:TRINITY_DN20652_c0_g1_i1.p1 TRINITY_DN20652_c0_g1~~TRINITY_DN20652_c0_g1_i1.p1  ORF type:complete len:135 (+),score=22.38 TRINITY_DN20652_c0_g1_i1:196-600(+)